MPPSWAVMVTALCALAILTLAPSLSPSAPSLRSAQATTTTGGISPSTTSPRHVKQQPTEKLAAGQTPAAAPRLAAVTAAVPEAPTSTTSPSTVVNPVVATPSRRWSTSGFLAVAASSSATYAIPSGPPGRSLAVAANGGGSVLITGCGLKHLAVRGDIAIPTEACAVELDLEGAGPVSFTISTEAT